MMIKDENTYNHPCSVRRLFADTHSNHLPYRHGHYRNSLKKKKKRKKRISYEFPSESGELLLLSNFIFNTRHTYLTAVQLLSRAPKSQICDQCNKLNNKCSHAEQTTEHILQDCRNLQSLRDETWLEATTIHEKLYGPVEELKRTTTFTTIAALQV
jgi:hypothetical protein